LAKYIPVIADLTLSAGLVLTALTIGVYEARLLFHKGSGVRERERRRTHGQGGILVPQSSASTAHAVIAALRTAARRETHRIARVGDRCVRLVDEGVVAYPFVKNKL
jgi:hypothetical protein